MLLIRKFRSVEDANPKEVQVDELDFDLAVLYLKEFLCDTDTYSVEVIRLWGGKLSNVETVAE